MVLVAVTLITDGSQPASDGRSALPATWKASTSAASPYASCLDSLHPVRVHRQLRVRDRVTGATRLQHMSGLGYRTYWLTIFLCDVVGLGAVSFCVPAPGGRVYACT